jgi:hypothetical protein
MRSGWYLGLSDASGDAIFSPRKLVEGWNILKCTVDARKPPGVLAVIDRSGLHAEPGYEELGVRHELSYISVEEAAEISSALEG